MASGGADAILNRGRRDQRLGTALLLLGFVVFVACLAWGFLFAGSSGQGSTYFLIDVIGSAGFALMLAGAVYFQSARAFRQRNKPSW